MRILPLLLSAIATAFLAGCQSQGTANVPLSYAKLDTGYLNSGIYDLGWVFAWDIQNKVLTPLSALGIPENHKNIGAKVTLQRTHLSADTDIVLSADLTKLANFGASVKTAIAQSTSTELNNAMRVTAEGEDVLNYGNAASRNWRKKIARDYPSGNYRFIIIDRVIRGDKVTVGLKRSSDTTAGVNILNITDDLKVQVKYSGENTFVLSGSAIPLVFQVRLFRMINESADPRFVPVTGVEARDFNFQHAIKTAK